MTPSETSQAPKGLSFFGVAMVLLGISALAAILIPFWFQQPKITLDSAAELLVKDIRGVQDHCVLTRTEVRIEFDADGGGYKIVDRDGTPLPAPLKDGPYEREYDFDAVFRGVRIESADFGGEPILRFGKDGYSKHDGAVSITFEGETRRVIFSQNVARIEGAEGE
ncbi:MAG: hypothetical protein KDB61_14855 [Planctomycetes bacterium]|nr:hypothetical protein [Planctomycetota bacterium]